MESRQGPIKRKNQKSISSPYARPAGDKSFFKKVKDFLKPSWFTALTTSPKSRSDRGEIFSDSPSSSSTHQIPSHQYNSSVTQGSTVYAAATGSDARRQEAVPESPVGQSVVPPPTAPLPQNMFPANVSVIPHAQQRELYNYNGQQQQSLSASTPYPSGARNVPTSKRGRRLSSEDMPPNVELSGRPSLDQSAPSESITNKRARLILDDNGIDDSTSRHNRSSLNISSLAQSFSQSMNSSILNSKDLSNSSFYPGKTVYGGGSSRRSFNMSAASPYKRTDPRQKLTESRKQQQPRVASRTAKLIMKALDQTGFHETPSNSASKNRDVFSPAVYLRRKSNNLGSGSKPKQASVNTPAPPKAAMQTAVPARILSNTFKPPADVASVSELSSSNIQVKPLVSSFIAEPSTSSSAAGGKLKRDRGQGHYSFRQEDTTAEGTPALPTGFKLAVPEGAQLNFGLMKPTPASTASASDFSFKFTPLQPVGDSEVKVAPSTTAGNFAFTSPIKVDDANFKLFSTAPKILQPPNVDMWCCTSCSTKNSIDRSICIGCSKPRCQLNPTAATFIPKTMQPGEVKWRCDTCLVQNDQSKDKCAVCSSAKPATSKPATSSWASVFSNNTKSDGGEQVKATPASSGWGNLFTNSASKKWSCPTCLINNDEDKQSCVACSTAKPASKQNSGSVQKESASVSSGSWGDLFNKSDGQWSCACCLVSNVADKDNCVACGVAKPDSRKDESSQKPTSAVTSFASSWGAAYQNTGKWRCDTCMVENNSDKHVCTACQTKKAAATSTSVTTATKAAPVATSGWAGVFQSSTGNKWRCDSCMIENESDNKTCVACQTTKPVSTTTAASSVNTGAPVCNWGNLVSATAGGKWRCDTCMVENNSDKQVCAACQTRKPASVASTTATKPIPAATASWGDTFKNSTGKWRCDTCMVDNTSDKHVCVACQTKKPDTQSSTAPKLDVTGTATAGWSSASSPTTKLTGIWAAHSDGGSKWNCDTCLVVNEDSSAVCAACSAPKPGSTASNSQLAPQKASRWQCAICMVSNAGNVSLCAACGACKPGTQSSLGELGKGKQLPLFGVKFGLANSNSESSVSSKPLSSLFGDESKQITTPDGGGMKLPAGSLKFGAQASSSSKTASSVDTSAASAPTTQGFKLPTGPLEFGNMGASTATTSDTGSSSDKTVTKTAPVTESGVKTVPDQKATNNVNISQTTLPSFKSGTQNTDSQKSDSATKQNEPSKPPTDGEKPKMTFQFGATSATDKGTFKPASESKTEGSTKPLFQFGSNTSSTVKLSETKKHPLQSDTTDTVATGPAETESKKAVFQFGSSGSTGQQSTTTTPAFQFGAGSTTTESTEAKKPNFQFGSTTNIAQQPAAKNPLFQFGSGIGTAEQQTEGSKPQFQFGSTIQNTSSDNPPAFQFGSTAATTTQAPTGDTAKTAFQFGAPKPSEPAKTSSQAPFQFGSSSTTTDTKNPPFQFGANTSINSQSSTSAVSEKPGFSFGAHPPSIQSSTALPPTFQFGSASSTSALAQPSDAAKPASFGNASAVFGSSTPAASAFGAPSNPTNQGIFGKPGSSTPFGAPTTTATGFQFGTAAPAAAPSFNFGAGASTSTPGSTLFQFGQTAPSGTTSAFQAASSTATAAPSDSAPRQFKKATRRLKKPQ